MTVERRLLLVRHGITAWNREGRFQGHLDPPLSDEGRDEARALGLRLAGSDEPPARIISSSLSRARETAELLCAEMHAAGVGTAVSVEPEPRLMEIGQGEWEGRTHAELERDDATRYSNWRSHRGDQQPPGAETIQDALARVAELLDEVDHAPPPAGGPVCLVSHGGTLRLVARRLLDLSPPQTWSLDLDNASLSRLSWTADGWRLEAWNDASHLLGRGPTHVDESEGEPLAL